MHTKFKVGRPRGESDVICSMHSEVREAYKIFRTDYLKDLEMNERFILLQHLRKSVTEV
jgi:hypothetical protein